MEQAAVEQHVQVSQERYGFDRAAQHAHLLEAADTVEWRWRLLENATTLPGQASAFVELSNAMADLASFLPGYDIETGEVERPEF